MTTRIMWVDSMLDAQLLMSGLDHGFVVDGIPVDDTSGAKSCMLIQTAHSLYLFLGSTPADPRGLLVGGVFGEKPIEAFLVGAISTSNSESEYPTSLTAGSRAVFHILSNGEYRRVVTSPIVKLIHTHVRSSESLGTVH
jgi:hypothetical protein